MDAGQLVVALVRAHASLVHRSLEVGGDAVATCLCPLQLRLVEHDRVAGRGEDLGDAVAHQAGTADEDRLG